MVLYQSSVGSIITIIIILPTITIINVVVASNNI